MADKRYALIVACDTYLDPDLSRLRAPGRDADALAEVLRDQAIGNFEVQVSLNERSYQVREQLERFFRDRGLEDVVLVHFSCHGIKDDSGRLFFAATDTQKDLLNSTGIGADFVSGLLRDCRSRGIVLLLDCCYSGAFTQGMLARGDNSVGATEQLQGRGRAIITASNALEYAWEGNDLTTVGEQPSVFTSALVKGLKSGDADLDGDGRISVDELYQYVFDEVRRVTPKQNPNMVSNVQGIFVVALNAHATLEELPEDLVEGVRSPRRGIREGAFMELAKLARGRDAGLAHKAEAFLDTLSNDDSRIVSETARRVLAALEEERHQQQPTAIGVEDKPPKTLSPVKRQELAPPTRSTDERNPAYIVGGVVLVAVFILIVAVLGRLIPFPAGPIVEPTPVAAATALPTSGPRATLAPVLTVQAQPSKWQVLAGEPPPLGVKEAHLGLAVDRQGTVYVADTENDRIQVLDPITGQPVASFGKHGSGTGEFDLPMAVAVDRSGNLWVSDMNNNRVLKLGPSGEQLLKVGELGTKPGQFQSPFGLALDGDGNLYVADVGNNRIQKFDPGGKPLEQFGAPGGGDGQFNQPKSVAVDTKGNMYVADTANNRVQELDKDGKFVQKWGKEGRQQGQAAGQFFVPWVVALDNSDNLYVADTANDRVQKFDAAGQFKTQWGGVGMAAGSFHLAMGMAVDSHGTVYVSDSNPNRIQRFSLDGLPQTPWTSARSDQGHFQRPTALAVDKFGNVYVTDTLNARIQKLGSNGAALIHWGAAGTGASEFSLPHSVALDDHDQANVYVYVADSLNHRIQKFGADGTFSLEFGKVGNGLGQFAQPHGVAVAADGTIYVADTANHRIQKMTPDGKIKAWGSFGNGDGQFTNPNAVAVGGPDGSVYVADTGNSRIQIFDPDGKFLFSWGPTLTLGTLSNPLSVAVDKQGLVYVADTPHHRIVQIDQGGKAVAQWGGLGQDKGLFDMPEGVAVDTFGNIYVADTNNNRIQKFTP